MSASREADRVGECSQQRGLEAECVLERDGVGEGEGAVEPERIRQGQGVFEQQAFVAAGGEQVGEGERVGDGAEVGGLRRKRIRQGQRVGDRLGVVDAAFAFDRARQVGEREGVGECSERTRPVS